MFTDQFKHELNSYLKGQGKKLLAHQSSIADQAFKVRSGQLQSDVWRTLNAAIPKQMVKVIEDNFKSV